MPDSPATNESRSRVQPRVITIANPGLCRAGTDLLAFLLVAAVYLFRLDAPLLWNDEADTAVFARNVLDCGFPVAFDGRNVSTDGDCLNLSRDHLLQKLHPWLQYYVAALSLHCFGHDTFGARALCALLGAASFFPLTAMLRCCTRTAVPMAMLLLLEPQVVLFQRQCRYFPLLILLSTSLLLVAAGGGPRNPRLLFFSAVAISVAMFHTHPLAALCACASVSGVLACTDRRRLPPFFAALAIGLLSWAAWFWTLGPSANRASAALPPVTTHAVRWLFHTAESLLISILDLDYVNALPLLAWGAIAAIAFFRHRRSARTVLTAPVPLLIVVNIAVHLLATAALTGYESVLKFSLLRYMPHLILLAPLPLFMLVEAMAPRRLSMVVIATLALCNVLTLSYWRPSLPLRSSVVSWWPPVYAEILAPPPDSRAAAIAFMRKQSMEDSTESLIHVEPQFLNDIFIFYLGDRYLIQPWTDAEAISPKVLRSALPNDSIQRLFAEPAWQVLFLTHMPRIPPGWSAISLPSDRDSADGTRPELTRHRFPREIPGAILLLRRKLQRN